MSIRDIPRKYRIYNVINVNVMLFISFEYHGFHQTAFSETLFDKF